MTDSFDGLPFELQAKFTALKAHLAGLGSILVAFSGGVDSSLLIRVAADVLGDKAAAATVDCAMYPEAETTFAKQLARELGVKHFIMEMDVLADEAIIANTPDRCYVCKKAIFGRFVELAKAEGLAAVADGSNVDDNNDFRPGSRAVAELEVLSPLKAAGLTKAEIRLLSKGYGLSNWDKPAAACLASRIPYGVPLTAQRLEQVGKAERILREMGFRQVRVRHHGDIARIEVPPADIQLMAGMSSEVDAKLKALGFAYVGLDLGGYRTGSMNDRLTGEAKEKAMGADMD